MGNSLQDILAKAHENGNDAEPPYIRLDSGEYEGPAVIDKPVILAKAHKSLDFFDKSRPTIWAKHGPVIAITTPAFSLNSLRVEVTEGDPNETAIDASAVSASGIDMHSISVRRKSDGGSCSYIPVHEVEVFGRVKGFGKEDGAFLIPRTLDLGELSANEENTFRMVVDIPVEAAIAVHPDDKRILSFSPVHPAEGKFAPRNIPAGRSEIIITVSGMGLPALFYAEVLFETSFIRRIYVSGRFSANAPAVKDKMIFEASRFAPPMPVSDVISDFRSAPPPAENTPPKSTAVLQKGERVPIERYIHGKCVVELTGQKSPDIDVDPYVFLLNRQNRAIGDKGFVFFGNEASPDGAVRYNKDYGNIELDLSAVSDEVCHIVVCYSVYRGCRGESMKNFSKVKEPRLSLFSGWEERVRFDMGGLSDNVTIIAADFYRYKGEWRISAVGSGYGDGLKRLCEAYGLNVV